MKNDFIIVKGARQNNLKGVDVTIPRDKCTTIVGVSGSGKSSLAYDVIFAESQRRYIDSFSTYVKRFISQLGKPKVDLMKGLSPVIALKQKKGRTNPRSTVGTMTEINDYIRLLYATAGEAHCPYCDCKIKTLSVNSLAETIARFPYGTMIEVTVPYFYCVNETYQKAFEQIRAMGYRKVYVDLELCDIGKKQSVTGVIEGSINIYIDKFIVAENMYKNIVEILRVAENAGYGVIEVKLQEDADDKVKEELESILCPIHHTVMVQLQAFHFSFNDIYNSCTVCHGLGSHRRVEPQLLVTNESKSINGGALSLVYNPKTMRSSWKGAQINGLADKYGFSLYKWYLILLKYTNGLSLLLVPYLPNL